MAEITPVVTGRDLSLCAMVDRSRPVTKKTTKMQSRKRNRMLNYDYSQDGIYFITVCTKDRRHHFGKVHYAEVYLNDSGLIAKRQILWLAEQYHYLELHNFVVMPNHVHLLFQIDRSKVESEELKIKTVSSIMGAYKTTSSKAIHLNGNVGFRWQRSFHDHIVRSKEAYEKIFQYISNNPQNWEKDKFRDEE